MATLPQACGDTAPSRRAQVRTPAGPAARPPAPATLTVTGNLPGISINLNGNKDAYPLEGSDLSVYDSAQQTWVIQGDIIELSGKSDNCAWDPSANACG